MKIKLITGSLIAIFLTIFIYSDNRIKVTDNDYRDAMGDFTYMNAEDVSSQDIPLPNATPAHANDYEGGHIQQIAIYGDNTLNDYYKINKSLQQLADSVVAIVKKSALIYDNDSQTYKALNLKVIGDERNLGKNADFANQKILSFCSGSLVDEGLVLTAGHCISKTPGDYTYYEDVYVIFGWKQTKENEYNTTFTREQVYNVDRVVVHRLADSSKISDNNEYQDYSLIKLDRRTDKKPLAIDRTGDFLVVGNKVFLAGYPMGMSVKVTDPNDASIQDIGKTIYSTDLDAFGGNSGGPVFDSYTRRITGVVVTANAKQFKYTLQNNVVLSFKTDQATSGQAALNPDRNGFILEVSQVIFNGLSVNLTRAGAQVENAAKTITFPQGLVYYDNDVIGGLISAVSEEGDVSGEPVKLPAYEGIGTGVQKIDSLIEALTPLTDMEIKICESISSQMRAERPIINPKLMMLYKMNRCDKSQSI
jgi:V8-like Glu-specific endopeptidase